MALKDILVLVDGSERDHGRIEFAAELARQHSAHLTGIALPGVDEDGFGSYAAVPMIPASVLAEAMERYRAEADARLGALEAGFNDAIRRAGVPSGWEVIVSDGPGAVAARARAADLMVLGQPHPEPKGMQAGWDVVEEVLLSSGNPVLTLPYVGTPPALLGHVLVAWNGSREAARAVAGGMALLRAARRVTIVSVVPASEVEPDYLPAGVDLAQHLGRHGVHAEVSRAVTGGLASADALLDFAADCGAELLVMGAYGQSRLREAVVGGVSRAMLRHQTLPLLLAH